MLSLLSASLCAAALVSSASVSAASVESAAALDASYYEGNPIMSILKDSWQGAHAKVGTTNPRMTIAHFIEGLEGNLRSIWDSFPEEDQLVAMAQATRPLDPPPPNSNPLPGPYWRWVPEVLGDTPVGAPLSFSSPCFASNNAVGSWTAGGDYQVSVSVSAPSANNCTDSYLLGTGEWLNLLTFSAASGAAQNQTATFPVTSRPGGKQWVMRHGARVLRFLDPEPLTIVWEALATASLFIPALLTASVDTASAQRNYDFLAGYANITMPQRTTPNVTIDPDLIGTGDVLVIHRPDGLATIEQWATGAATSHTVCFMRTEATNELMVCESQSVGADWPIDRIQCNTWADWMAIAYTNSYAIVWMPLTAEARAQFNNTAAWAFINSTLQVNYGFQDFAPTFYDTEFDNLPWPARPESLEVVIAVVAGLLDPFISDEGIPLINLLFTQTNVMHLGGSNYSVDFLETMETTAQRNMTYGQLLAMPEQDEWLYPMATGEGPTAISRVCNAYVCSIQKAAGLLGDLADSINCADTHNNDLETFPTLDPAPVRPAACVAADPDAAYCQFTGERHVPVPTWRTSFYAHMDETCTSLPTAYARAAGC